MPANHDASFVDTMPANVAVQFFDRVAKSSTAEAYRFPVGETWESVTWAEAGDRVTALAAGLLSLGIENEQRVGIASGTRYEWILADLAIMCAGAATTTVYPSTNGEDTSYILSDSGSRVVFAEDDEQLEKLRSHRDELPEVMKVVTFDGTTDGDWVIDMDALAELGRAYLAEHPGIVEETAAEDPARPARHPDLHLRHHRPAQGRAPGAPLVGLRGRGHPRPGPPARGRPAVPVAADGALLRQGAALLAAGLRLRHGDRRPRRQDHREPRGREADVHGRGPPHLREGLLAHPHDAGRRGRGEGEDLHQGLRGRRQGRRPQAPGQVRSRCR